ncbi:uncharacterized protein LOC129703217 [Leucoraja erinacea]|uniref:uncharacterized protein LOC129703217 n=1 Tax=Leucoraja erinaceus TaxID=7782 RepID=UPI0024588054|nr:uncharacterized protein LOC129703217 [Leucoraja erinacea]
MDLDAEWTEREFQQMVKAIGGRESIFLIGEVCDSRDLMFQFVNNMFPRHGKVCSRVAEPRCEEPKSECGLERESENLLDPSAKVTQIVNGNKEQRMINARLIIFLFHQDFICDKLNDLVIRELLKDVRLRCGSWKELPALIGVVHADSASGQLGIAVRLVEYYLRTIFHRQPGECVQALPFISNQPDSMLELKKTTCVVLRAVSGVTEDVKKRRQTCFPEFFCFLGNTRRRREDRDVDNIRNSIEKEGISKDAEKDFASQQLTVGSHMTDVCKSDLQINSNGNNELNIETEV